MQNEEEITGEKLRELRKKFRLTQIELGQKLGIKQGSITRWERGDYEISIPYQKLFTYFFNELEIKRQNLENLENK